MTKGNISGRIVEEKQLLQPQKYVHNPPLYARLLALHWSALTLDTQCTPQAAAEGVVQEQSYKLIQQVIII